MYRKMVGQFLLCVVLILAFFFPAFAGEPTEVIRKTTDKIIAIVQDPALQGPEKKSERDRLIRAAAEKIFDKEEMSRRTLARHWRKRTPQEKEEFMELFEDLLEKTYIDRVEGYSGEKVLYQGERVEGNYALVKVDIMTKQETKIPVLYRLKKKQKGWLVYDLSIEGVSLINNYRTQFNSIIMRSSFKGLIKKLKAKVGREN
ncbi:MAG: ABC transporter substrate-binding protein [Deltaproteobacteria bacterium]|nr:ABC transporter substrate-binding protein [Deltaproteobacteria bacterium]